MKTPIMKNSFWTAFECDNSTSCIMLTDDRIIDAVMDRYSKITDMGNGLAQIIVGDDDFGTVKTVSRAEATGRTPVFPFTGPK
jgi:hypothetical protein